MRIVIVVFVIALSSHNCMAQRFSDDLWKALQVPVKHYNKAQYHEAAEAYKNAFSFKKDNDYADHRLFAAASNCMIDNEIGVKENLFAMIPISTKRDMQKVLVNYEIFNKYKNSEWWIELKASMDKRLENLIARHKNLHFFKEGRNLVYKAIRINEVGDTLANTFVTMIPDGTGWGDEAATLQSQVIYEYQYTLQDSIDHCDELNEIVTPKFWLHRDTTGVIENEEQVWIHPIRKNEFFKTELAPFPKVIYPISVENVEAANSKLMILQNCGSYTSSVTENEYTYLGEELRCYAVIGELKCHKFKAESFNNFHGASEIEYYFNSDLGFVEMNYLTYDNDKIRFALSEVLFE